jgi:hypothetical protein
VHQLVNKKKIANIKMHGMYVKIQLYIGLFTNLNNGCTKCCVKSIIRNYNFINIIIIPLFHFSRAKEHVAEQKCDTVVIDKFRLQPC